jgi:hypothetical protein
MSEASSAIAEFWKVFEACEARLALAESAVDSAYEVLLAKLHEIDSGLYLEFCSDPTESELIVTADGDRSLFPLVREIVAAAPTLRGWTIRALKPKLGFPTTVSWDDLTIRIEEVVFAPLENEGTEDFGLRLFVPGIRPADTDNAHSAMLRALDHGLGEEKLAQAVHFTEVRPLPEEAEPADFIPLVELETFLEWRETSRGAELS